MLLTRWLHSAPTPKPAPKRTPARRRLAVEVLEDRTTPAAAAVILEAAPGTGGVQFAVTAAVADPSPADQAVGFRYVVDWGDGTTDTVTPAPGNGSGVSLGHTYPTTGLYRPVVTAAGPDGVFGAAAPVGAVVAGSPGVDTIKLTGGWRPDTSTEYSPLDPSDLDYGFEAKINGQTATAAVNERVLVVAGAGGDTITLTNWEPTADLPDVRLWIDGQGGSDTYTVNFTFSYFRQNDRDFWLWNTGYALVSVTDTGGPDGTDKLSVNGTSRVDRLIKSPIDYFSGADTLVQSQFDVEFIQLVGAVALGGIEDLTIAGGGGSDVINDPGPGNTTILGGPDDDTILVADTSGAVTADGGDGSDTVTVQFGNIQGPVTIRDTGTTGSDTLEVRPADGGQPLTATGSSVSQGSQTVTVAGPPGFIPLTTPAGTPPPQVTNGAVLFRTASGTLDLLVGGTAGNDHVLAYPADTTGGVAVRVNGTAVGTFRPTGRVAVSGYAGHDTLSALGLAGRADLFGDAGSDLLVGGSGPNILVGGDGADLLYGGAGRDVLVGGAGSDLLAGGGGDDLLIAAATTFDADASALGAVLAEWTSTHSYATRVANLTGTGSGPEFDARRNGTTYLLATGPAPTVTDDDAADILIGDGGREWFFAQRDGDHGAARDLLLGRLPDEFVIDLDDPGQ